jgi:hypothetical protein
MKFANATMLHRRSGGPASSPVLESVAPLFGLPDGLYPNHRILFHQYKESPLQQNEALRAPRVPREDGALQSAAPKLDVT